MCYATITVSYYGKVKQVSDQPIIVEEIYFGWEDKVAGVGDLVIGFLERRGFKTTVEVDSFLNENVG